MPDQLNTLIQQANQAFERGDFDAVIEFSDQVQAEAPQDSAAAEQARVLRRHAVEHELLSEINAAADWETALPLLDQAKEKGLIHDLSGLSLDETRNKWQGVRQENANQFLNSLLEEGDRFREEGKLRDALEKYEQAAETSHASAKSIENAKERSQSTQETLNEQNRSQSLHQEALDKQEVGDFPAALNAAQRALSDAPEEKRDALRSLVRELEEQVAQVGKIEQLQWEAEQAGEDVLQAERKLQTALKIAETLALEDKQEQLDALLADVQSQRQERQKEAEDKIEAGKKALQNEEWREAIKHLKAAQTLAPLDEISALLARAQTGLDTGGEVQRLIRAGEVEAAPSQKLESFRQAKALAPDYPEIDKLIEAAEKDLAKIEMSATHGEIDLGFETPEELEDNIQSLLKTLGDKAQKIVEERRRIFGRVAARKLSEFVETQAEPNLLNGDYDAAVQAYEEAIRMWDMAWLKEGSIVWQRYEGETYTEYTSREALKARLKIVANQKQQALQAKEVYPTLQENIQKGEAALEKEDYELARDHFNAALEEITSQPPDMAYALRGIKKRIQQNLSTALRRWGVQISADIKQDINKIIQWRDQGGEHLEKAFILATEITRRNEDVLAIKSEFMENTPAIQHSGWGAPDLQDEIQTLYDQIVTYRESRAALAEAEAYMVAGNYSEAEARFQVIDLDTHWGEIAANRMDNLKALRGLKAEVEKARNDGDYRSALDGLGKIISLDGRAEWAVDLQKQIRPLADRRRDADNYLDQAESAMKRGGWENALAHIRKALEKEDGYKRALELQGGARTGLERKQNFLLARAEVVETFNGANELADYERALDLADTILAYDPDDRIGKNYHDLSQQLIELGEKIRDAMLMETWSEAEKLVAEARAYHRESNYLSSVGREIDQKLAMQVKYEELLSTAKQAIEEEDWSTAFLKATRAAEKRPRVKEPRQVAAQARQELIAIVHSCLNREKTIEIEDFKHGRQAVEAIRAAEGDEDISEELGLLERARRLLDAQNAIERGDSKSAQNHLKPIIDKDPGDVVVQALFEQSKFAVLLDQGKQALAPPPKYEQANDALRQAVKIKPEDEEARRLKDEAALGYGLVLFNQGLRNENLEDASAALRSLPQDHPRVEEACTLLNLIIENEREARQKFSIPDHQAALEAVDTILNAVRASQTVYPPAETLRTEILNDAFERAKEADGNQDYEQALKYYRLCREKGQDHIREKARQRLETIENDLEQQFTALVIRVQQAVTNPDITEAERSQLETELDTALRRSSDRSTHHTNAYLQNLKGLQPLIAEVEKYLNRAKEEMDKALEEANTFDDASGHFLEAKNMLESARAVGIGQFVQRQACRDLGKKLSKHARIRKETLTKWNAYQKAKDELEQATVPKLSHQALTSNLIEEIHEQGIKHCDNVLALNRQVKQLDPDNTYKVRNWPDRSQQDPLEKEAIELQRQKDELNQTAITLKEALKTLRQAIEANQVAEEMMDKPSHDRDFQSAVDHWDDAIESYDQTISRLKDFKEHNRPVNPLIYTQTLYRVFRPLREHCEHMLTEVKQQRKQAEKMYEELSTIRPDARENYLLWESHQSGLAKWSSTAKKAAEAAREHYQDIDRLNPYDQNAKSRLKTLNEYSSDYRSFVMRLALFVAAGIGVCIIGIATIFTLRPGGVLNPYTATPTATVTSTYTPAPTGTALPTHTSTPGPSPTFTLTPLPPTPTETLPATSTPILCTVLTSGWLREKPDFDSTGLTLLSSGTDYRVIDAQQDQDGELWYEVLFNPGGRPDRGYFPANRFSSSCTP